jgi:hypothetical protein
MPVCGVERRVHPPHDTEGFEAGYARHVSRRDFGVPG